VTRQSLVDHPDRAARSGHHAMVGSHCVGESFCANSISNTVPQCLGHVAAASCNPHLRHAISECIVHNDRWNVDHDAATHPAVSVEQVDRVTTFTATDHDGRSRHGYCGHLTIARPCHDSFRSATDINLRPFDP